MNKSSLAGLAGLVTLLVTELQPAPAEACGVKLVVRTPTPRHAVARSSRPSSVLVLGSPPNRLTRDLVAMGHSVEVVNDAETARKGAYAAVLTDEQHAASARKRFGNDVVVVRTSDIPADLRRLELQVGRRPIRTDSERAVVAARVNRKPIAAGPTDNPARRDLVAAAPRTTPDVRPETRGVTPPVTPTQPVPTQPAITDTARPTETAPTRRMPEKQLAKPARAELYFGVGAAKINRRAAIARVVKWLNDNPDVGATIEGHADPSGSPEINMTLSQTRAEAVREAIIAAGIDGGRLEVAAFGNTRLKYGRSDGRNRRVAIEPKP